MGQQEHIILPHHTVDIGDLARLSAYQSDQTGKLDFQAQAMDIYLFCVQRGQLSLQASFIPHPIELAGSEAIFLAFPKGEWSVGVEHTVDTQFVITRMDVASMHKIIDPSLGHERMTSTPAVNFRNLMKRLPLTPTLMMCFEQLFYHKLQPPFSAVFEKAKFLEIFSLIMETAFGQKMDACPVVLGPAIEEKIREVRQHIILHLDEVPDPDQLALQFDMPRQTLREGYRYLYGKTIHQYHTDYKMESAMQMLSSGEWLVKEIAFRIGYQNPSHFITAFKKKYGFTPKQYLKKEVAIA